MNAHHHAVLHALFVLARNDHHATVLRLCRSTGLERAVVQDSLVALERAGLADVERVRLTMQGLAAATILGAPARRTPVSRRAA